MTALGLVLGGRLGSFSAGREAEAAVEGALHFERLLDQPNLPVEVRRALLVGDDLRIADGDV